MFTTQHLKGLFKTDVEMIPRGMPHPQISYWRCLRCVSYQRFQSVLGVGHKVLVIRHFLTTCKLFLLSRKSRFVMRKKPKMPFVWNWLHVKKTSCFSTLLASCWWMVTASGVPTATAPNRQYPHTSLSMTSALLFIVIDYFQMALFFSAACCHSCNFPCFSTVTV